MMHIGKKWNIIQIQIIIFEHTKLDNKTVISDVARAISKNIYLLFILNMVLYGNPVQWYNSCMTMLMDCCF